MPQGVRRYVLEQCCYLIEAVCVGAEVVTIRPSACEIELSRIMVGTGRPWWTHVQAVRGWDPNTAPTVSKKLHKFIGAYGRKTTVFLAYYDSNCRSMAANVSGWPYSVEAAAAGFRSGRTSGTKTYDPLTNDE